MNKTPVPHIFLRKDHTLHTSKNTRRYDNSKKNYKMELNTGKQTWQSDEDINQHPSSSYIMYPKRNVTKTIK